MFTLYGGAPVTCLAYAPDGHSLASGDEGGIVRVWDLAARQERLRFIPPGGPGDVPDAGYITSLAYSPDSTHLVMTAGDHPPYVWVCDSATGKVQHRYEGGWSVRCAVFSPDGTVVASVGGWVYVDFQEEHPVYRWRLGAKGRLRLLLGHTRELLVVTYSPDGSLLATGGDDRTVRLWNTDTGQLRGLLRHRGSINAVAFSPDGRTLATTGGRSVDLWDLDALPEAIGPGGRSRPPRRAVLRDHQDKVHALAFTPDGATLGSAADDHTVRLWDTATGSAGGCFDWGLGSVRALGFDSAGMTAAVGGENGNIVVWDLEG
jgi:WD40 repeat protein